jgi:hypothetical protein
MEINSAIGTTDYTEYTDTEDVMKEMLFIHRVPNFIHAGR